MWVPDTEAPVPLFEYEGYKVAGLKEEPLESSSDPEKRLSWPRQLASR
jgi:hypothetical protein